METITESIYDHPKYYDLVFGADCAAEVRFIHDCGEAFMSGRLKRMFEPACGTGRLLSVLARQGHAVGGVDLNPKAIEFCNTRFKRNGWPESASVADMCDFHVSDPADIAFNTINSFRHIASESAARKHLECMAAAVRSGGLYLLGLHLSPTAAEPSEGESWAARRGHLSITTRMWTIKRDPARRVERFGIQFDIHTPKRSFRIDDILVLRSYTRKQIHRLIRSCDAWETLETYDFGYDIEAPIIVDDRTEDVIFVLRRKED